MRIFVTGGSGFIGRRLVETAVSLGHEVVCLSRSGRTSAMLAEVGAHVLSGDLTDESALRGAIQEAKPTHVAHLAAAVATHRDRERIEQVNVHGTRAILDACRDLELSRFVFVSSVVRGKAEGQTFTEDDSIPATTAYGLSKQLGDEMVLEAHREWGLPSIILRPSNVYGPGGWLADIVRSRQFRIPGSGDNVWDVVHVDDVVSACLLLLKQGPPGEVFHVVDDEPVKMKEFFNTVASALGRRPFGRVPVWVAKLARGADPITTAIRDARSTNTKLRGLGWQPRYPRSLEALPAVVAHISEQAKLETEARTEESS